MVARKGEKNPCFLGTRWVTDQRSHPDAATNTTLLQAVGGRSQIRSFLTGCTKRYTEPRSTRRREAKPRNNRERDPTYGDRLHRVSQGFDKPPAAVLEMEGLRAYRTAQKCRKLSHEDALDVAQQYCVKILEAWGSWDQKRCLFPFLNRLLFRELVNHGRRNAKANLKGKLSHGQFGEQDEGDLIVYPEPTTFDAGEEGDAAIRHEYLSLVECPVNRDILELTLEGAEVEEIVVILGLNNTQRVYVGRNRGRDDIRRKIQPE